MASPKKSPQILTLEPAEELVFEGPFDRVVTSYLELKNPSDQRVCFKVKTTAPHRYGVRPNSGVLQPAGKIRIAIMFHPTERDSQSERARHKFMVQSIILQSETTQSDTIWKEAKSEDIMDSKLRCIFRHADSGLETRDAPTSSATTATAPAPLPTSALSAEGRTASASASGTQQLPATGAVSKQSAGVSLLQQQQQQQQPSSTQHQQQIQQQHQQSASKQQHQHHQQSASKQPASKVISSSSDGGERSVWNETSASLNTTRDLTSLYRPMVVISFIVFIVGVILGKYII